MARSPASLGSPRSSATAHNPTGLRGVVILLGMALPGVAIVSLLDLALSCCACTAATAAAASRSATALAISSCIASAVSRSFLRFSNREE